MRKTKGWKKKAWTEFSKYIRNRDKRCITCGSTTSLQAGHYIHNRLDFNEVNISAQCSGCNLYKSGNLTQYALYLEATYGKGILQKLDTLAKRELAIHYDEEYYKKQYEKYKKLNT